MNKANRPKAKKGTKRTAKVRGKRSSAAIHRGISGGLDFIGAAFFALVILLMLFMLSSLVTWVRRDRNVVFSDLGTSITDALIIRRDTTQQAGR